MPHINIRIGTHLNPVQRRELQRRTTVLISEIMGKKPEVTVVHIQESPSGQWSTNGVPLTPSDPPGVYVDIKVTQGTNTTREKADMIDATVSMLREVVGKIQEPCYVVIDELPADSWGYNGRTQAARAAEGQLPT